MRRKGENCLMRKHFTKQFIEDALFELLKTKPIQNVTITELVQRAGVSKASFYRNFLDINSVINEYLNKVFGNLYEICPINPANIELSIKVVLDHIYQHKDRLLILRKNNLLSNMDSFLFDCTLEEITRNKVLDNKYQPYFFTGATVGFISSWIKYDFSDSSDVMAKYFVRSLNGYMKFN